MEESKQGIPVLSNLASMVSYHGTQQDPLQVVTTGKLYLQGKQSLLRYKESVEDEETGRMSEDDVQLILGKNQVTMNRSGEYNNTMVFQKKRRFETTYRTPYGELPMAVYSRDVRCDLGKDSGKVHLVYELSMQGAYASTNELHLEYAATE